MNLAGDFKSVLNRFLRLRNAQIVSLAAERAETARLLSLEAAGHFDEPAFPLLRQFVDCNPAPILAAVERYASETRKFDRQGGDETLGYSFANDYFTSPDAEVAYAMLRELRPRRIVEVGSGNSTRLFRAAILDGSLRTEIVAIDPFPREEVDGVASRVYRTRLEDLPEKQLFAELESGDVLFIDSSHKIEAGNDVVTLLLRVVPRLSAGTILHVHDVFLPFEYPREWLVDFGWKWNEQYLVQALLQDSAAIEVLWPGYYLERTLMNFKDHFPAMRKGHATSLWLRKVAKQ
jgi:hypothetical protein